MIGRDPGRVKAVGVAGQPLVPNRAVTMSKPLPVPCATIVARQIDSMGVVMSERSGSPKAHEKLAVFLGDWHAEGTSYTGDDQSVETPHTGASPWNSIHSARWHSGGYFVVQDEHANGPFDTLSLLGWDPEAGRYFVRSIENHGFARDYPMTVEGNTWKLAGEHERASTTFSDDGRTQTIAWEWKPDDQWLPLCDRTAHRV